MFKGKLTEQLDEMQYQNRNKIGTQSFFLLYFLLLIDLLLKDYGVEWITGSVSTLVIMLVCMVYYLTRIDLAGAYAGYGSIKYVFVTVGLLAVLTNLITIARKTNFFRDSLIISDSGFVKLLLFFVIFFGVILISNHISKMKNNRGID